ncbi:hypothetical protein BC829DRAFT_388520 [Chytridium lagenaria]|nr:hypothetical protein BC829DRAFT_388520 [Chytridium lagenaria]
MSRANDALPSDHVNNPSNLASLALTLMQAGAWDPLTALSSIFIKERVEMLDSHSMSEKLPLFSWNRNLLAAANSFSVSSAPVPSDSETALAELWGMINGFEPKDGELRTFYRVWDEETVHAAVRFDFKNGVLSPLKDLTPPPSPPYAGKGGVVILHQNGANSWAYHDVKVVRNWDVEFADYFEMLSEAKERFRLMEKEPISDADDKDYWETYDAIHLKGVPSSAMNPAPDSEDMNTEEDEGSDYWDSFSANLPSY